MDIGGIDPVGILKMLAYGIPTHVVVIVGAILIIVRMVGRGGWGYVLGLIGLGLTGLVTLISPIAQHLIIRGMDDLAHERIGLALSISGVIINLAHAAGLACVVAGLIVVGWPSQQSTAAAAPPPR